MSLRNRIILACALAYTAVHFYFSGIREPLRNFYGDFLASFPSWRLSVLLGRLDLFDGSLSKKWTYYFGSDPLWHYGPVEHLVTLPLFAFPDLRSAYRAWLYANYAFLIAIAVLAASLFLRGLRRWIALAICAIVMFNYSQIYVALAQRVIEIFELLLIFIAFALLRRGRELTAGLVIGVAAMTKFLPLIFLPYFLVKRMWRALAGSLLAIVPIAVATEIVFGWRHSGTVFQLLHPQSVGAVGLAGFIDRMIHFTHSSLPPHRTAVVAVAAGLAGLTWLFYTVRNCEGAADVEWATLVVAMVMLAPRTEDYYAFLFLFSYFALLGHVRGRHLAWLAVSFLLLGVVVPFALLSRIAGADLFPIYLDAGIPFLGAAILSVICVRVLLDECRHTVCTLST